MADDHMKANLHGYLRDLRQAMLDILREEIDGAVGPDGQSMARRRHDAAFWEQRRAEIERAARAADA